MPRETSARNQSSDTGDCTLPSLIAIVGQGTPSNFEISVAGEIEMDSNDPLEEAVIVSNGAAEGAIDVGVQRFWFSGELANIRAVNWNGVEAPKSPNLPKNHIDYSVHGQ